MRTKLEKNETYLKGQWIEQNDEVIGDETCIRIRSLIAHLEEISSTSGGWETLYRDNSDGRYWELTYENSEWHGGGPPSLRNLSEAEAKEKYKV
jgi:hypothetical protein